MKRKIFVAMVAVVVIGGVGYQYKVELLLYDA
jgi:hypothetical protein